VFSKNIAAVLLLVFVAVLTFGAALRESPSFDEVAHIGAGLSYDRLQEKAESFVL
jgi:hypothetical protein